MKTLIKISILFLLIVSVTGQTKLSTGYGLTYPATEHSTLKTGNSFDAGLELGLAPVNDIPVSIRTTISFSNYKAKDNGLSLTETGYKVELVVGSKFYSTLGLGYNHLSGKTDNNYLMITAGLGYRKNFKSFGLFTEIHYEGNYKHNLYPDYISVSMKIGISINL